MTRHALVVAAFVASLLVVLATPRCTRDRVPDTTAWVGAVAQQRAALGDGQKKALVRRGDVVLVHPPWRDDVMRALVASGALPERAKATVALAPRHGDALPAVVVVTDEAAPLPDAIEELVDDESAAVRDGIKLFRLRPRAGTENGGRSLLDSLRDARVELRINDDNGDGATIPCPWDAATERHACRDQPEWQHVGMTKLPIGGRKVQCAWAHPKTGATLSIRFPHAELLDVVELSLALSDGASDNASGAPVTATLLVDGSEAVRVTRKARERGFATKSAHVSTGAAAGVDGVHDGVHDVEVRITTSNDGQRHACILLETRGAQ